MGTKRLFLVKGSHFYDIPDEDKPFIQVNEMQILFPKDYTNENVKEYLNNLAKENDFLKIEWEESLFHGITPKDYYIYMGSIDYTTEEEQDIFILEKLFRYRKE